MSHNRNLRLSNIEGITLGEVLLTSEALGSDARRWHGYALIPGIGEDKFEMNDEQLLRQLCFEYMPFTLTAEEFIVLRAEIVRFPYSINGNHAF